MVIVGKFKDMSLKDIQIKASIKANSSCGFVAMETSSTCCRCPDYKADVCAVNPANTAGDFIERMWAYQTIKKLLKQSELDKCGQSSATLRQTALQLSLKVKNKLYA